MNIMKIPNIKDSIDFNHNVLIRGEEYEPYEFFKFLQQTPNFLQSENTYDAEKVKKNDGLYVIKSTSHTDNSLSMHEVKGYIFQGKAFTIKEYIDFYQQNQIDIACDHSKETRRLYSFYEDKNNVKVLKGVVFDGKYYTASEYYENKKEIDKKINIAKYGSGFKILP